MQTARQIPHLNCIKLYRYKVLGGTQKRRPMANGGELFFKLQIFATRKYAAAKRNSNVDVPPFGWPAKRNSNVDVRRLNKKKAAPKRVPPVKLVFKQILHIHAVRRIVTDNFSHSKRHIRVFANVTRR